MQNRLLEVEATPVLNPLASAHAAHTAHVENADTEQNVLKQSTSEQEASEQESVATPAETQAIATLLAATQRKIRRRKRQFWGAFAVMEGSFALFIPVMHLIKPHTEAAVIFVFGMLVGVLTGFVLMMSTAMSRLGFSAEELENIGGVRAIGPLTDSLTAGGTLRMRKTVYLALARLLPKLKATDANLLNARHRRLLNRFLSFEAWARWWGPKPIPLSLSLAILKAYEQVGDAKAIPVVEKLAALRPSNERRSTVQQAALQCLPLLQSHTVPLDQTQTLLRAASQSGAAADVLLRPAADNDTAPADQLLRAADRETTP